ncbi:MAG: hypothetical protein QXS22_05270, partial [Acidilobaceae archaeon]
CYPKLPKGNRKEHAKKEIKIHGIKTRNSLKGIERCDSLVCICPLLLRNSLKGIERSGRTTASQASLEALGNSLKRIERKGIERLNI